MEMERLNNAPLIYMVGDRLAINLNNFQFAKWDRREESNPLLHLTMHDYAFIDLEGREAIDFWEFLMGRIGVWYQPANPKDAYTEYPDSR